MSLNLLPSQAKFQALKIKQQMLVNKIMIGVAVVWLFLAIIIFMAKFFADYRLKVVKGQYESVWNNYLGMMDDITIRQQLKYDAKLVGGSLNSRFEYGKSFELIQSLFPEGITLKDYRLKEKGFFEISGTTSGKNNLDTIEKIVEDINTGKDASLAKAKVTSLAVENNIWNFSMEVELK